MFCPGCSFKVNDDLKFCRQCGANLRGVREAMTSNSTGEKSDLSKNWWADIAHAHAMKELGIGITPEEKRLNEIKGGVITSFVGIGVMIFLYFFLDVVAKGEPNPGDAEIIRNVWMVGIIPFLIGISIIFNGLFISRRLVKLKEQQAQTAMPASQYPAAMPAKTTDQLVVDAAPLGGHSVTEDTTAHLTRPAPALHAARPVDEDRGSNG
jgi:hypothetical protein